MAPWKKIFAATAGTTVVTLAAAPVAIPAAVGALGFGAGGIVAGSSAAYIMSLYGGMVSAGSVCATMQSIGAVGALSGTTIAALEGGAVAAGTVFGVAWKKLFGDSPAPEDAPKGSTSDSTSGDEVVKVSNPDGPRTEEDDDPEDAPKGSTLDSTSGDEEVEVSNPDAPRTEEDDDPEDAPKGSTVDSTSGDEVVEVSNPDAPRTEEDDDSPSPAAAAAWSTQLSS